ncbi:MULTISPECIES: Cof-type HAD-IIB family hydrolase [Staphylococcus]|uniref:Hydrolase n=3 Tax=Staphylococcus aureus TaxID=1280 RepID=A0AAE8TKG5_STAAU|nr:MULTISPECIES: Cof-type HAD-IIB family hydrolase [Staphylococcus]ETO54473.1 HAD family hydrolase [Staphylococcus aureus MUM270]HDH6201621.1 HAD family hydrolase [Staphylococcus aureus LTCF-15-62]HDH6209959.1 HAD family hydrolase [Staphylococcus aureus LTCF-14-59]HDH6282140.1 HAD family hydrolase [Staphylococcus aureus LTCF-3-23]HDH6493606.1 HAD family hydrolase [Staphylococcus aureus MRSA-Lux-7]HDK8313852.1 HAD family hydrolase [Staphylococcus aureus subsp. aureus ST22]
MVKAIAVDMDGTFLDSKKTYDKPRFEAIFTELRNRDITFIAASGNQYAKLKSIFGDRDMYFISENGAVIYKGNELYNYKSFNRQVFQQVVDYLNMNQGIDQLVICGLKSAYILKHTSEAFKEDTRFYYHQLKEIDSLQQLPEDDYVKIAFNINRETHPNVDEEVATQFSNDIKLVSSGHDSIDIIMPNMTKGQALKRLLDKWEMSPSELMAFGDANNDKDMLAFAKHSYVMENSHDEELFNIASAVAPSNDKQGVLTIIEQEVLNK